MKRNLAGFVLAMGVVLLPASLVLAQATNAPTPTQAASTAPAGDAANGKKLYDTIGCFECHGFAGQGAQSTDAPHIAKTTLPFDAFLKQLRTPSSEMPPYQAAVVPDQQAADIYAYLQSLPGPVDMKKVTLPH